MHRAHRASCIILLCIPLALLTLDKYSGTTASLRHVGSPRARAPQLLGGNSSLGAPLTPQCSSNPPKPKQCDKSLLLFNQPTFPPPQGHISMTLFPRGRQILLQSHQQTPSTSSMLPPYSFFVPSPILIPAVSPVSKH